MIEALSRVAWLVLAAIHLTPAAVAFRPALVSRLYGLDGAGNLALLLRHRGVLFLAVVVACLHALLDPAARRSASLVVTISVLGFLWLYWRAGLPPGPLRGIARVDALALAPLLWVLLAAWWLQAA